MLIAVSSGAALAQVTASQCATPGRDGSPAALSGVVNTYYPGTASVAAGARCISVGTPTAGPAIAAGDLLLVMQMQHATINSSNNDAYGNNTAGDNIGQGVTNFESSGRYEYVAALGAVGSAGGVGCVAGQVPIRALSGGGGLLNAYTSAARSGNTGRATFQVIRVPQYLDATLAAGGISAGYWNGSTGGVVAIDVTGILQVNGQTINANERGFRGGGAVQLSGGGGLASTDYRRASTVGAHSSKGEGIAGTPINVYNPVTATVVTTGADEGYNNGSFARGAPGNGGGGGNDGNPSANDENAGGGGGGNGGAGGVGGNSWRSNLAVGGFGGGAFAPAGLDFTRVVLGGGGGAGSRNNSSGAQSSGGPGGGIVIVQAGIFRGPGSITANGGVGPAPANDAGGGGGAGGTILLRDEQAAPTSDASTITISANGGNGANAWPGDPDAGGFPGDRHGPGGGGGGGRVLYGPGFNPGTISRTGGAPGVASTNGGNYGSAGGTGTSEPLAYTGFPPGILPGFVCVTVPVTLAHFHAQLGAAGLEVGFATATETRNAGFRLYQDGPEGRRALNQRLIASKSGTSAEAKHYRLALGKTGAGTLWLADIDASGRETLNGPFEVGRVYGRAPEANRIDWKGVRRELAANRAKGATINAVGATLWARERGFHRVRYEDLHAAGIDLAGVPVAELAITSGGQPIARRAIGGATFGPGSALEFFADPGVTLYSAETPFLIERSAGAAVSIPSLSPSFGDAVPAWALERASYAPDREYDFSSPLDDPWFADRLTAEAGRAAGTDITLTLDAVAQVPGIGARLSGRLAGGTDFPEPGNDHHVRMSAAGSVVAETFADGLVPISIEASVNAPASGPLGVRVEAFADLGFPFSVVQVDRLELDYPRLPQARSGRWFAEALQLAPVPSNASVGSLPPAPAGGDELFAASFEELGFAGEKSIAVRGFAAGELIAYRRESGGWRHLANVRSASETGSTTAYVPVGASGGEAYFVANVASLPVLRIDPLPALAPLPSGPIDYLIVAHPAFVGSLDALVARKEAQGLRTAVIDLEQVYRRYSAMRREPAAVEALVRELAGTRGVQYLLLVGGDHYDYRDATRSGAISFVPTPYAATSEIVRYAPADSLYGDLDGDQVPELAVGRLPVRTPAELAVALAKLEAWSARSGPRHVLLAAGGSDAGGSGFKGLSDEFATLLPGSYSATRAYVDDLGAGAARSALLGGFGTGPDLVSFVGHSAPAQWTFDPILAANDAATLGNGGRASLVLQWGCWNAYFVSPSANSLAHAFLLSGDRGAVTVFGSTSLTAIASHAALGRAVMPRLTTGSTLGAAVIAAKRALAVEGTSTRDVVIGTTILGDPALPLR
jgi:hypothetical protein